MENVKALLSKQENMKEVMWYILKASRKFLKRFC